MNGVRWRVLLVHTTAALAGSLLIVDCVATPQVANPIDGQGI